MPDQDQKFDEDIFVKKHCEKCGRETSHIGEDCIDCATRNIHQEQEAHEKKAEKRAYESAFQRFRTTICSQPDQKAIDPELLARKLFDTIRRIDSIRSDNPFVGASH